MNDPGKTEMASPAPDAVAQAAAREAALREVLDLISRSRDDEGPVFEAILERAARLCGAHMADLDLVDPDGAHLREVATWGPTARATPSEQWVWPMDSDFRHVEAVRTGQAVHDPDIRDTERYRSGHEMTRTAVDEEGVRAFLAVPLMADGQGIGAILLFRQEPRPFTDAEIALVETFAAQAVIAIENARQFREVQARLAREQASAEVLAVISRSRDDERPVFEAILANTARLCETDLATLNLINAERTHLEYAAHHGRTLATYEVGVDRWSLDSTLQIAESVREARIVHNVDLRETDLYVQGDRWRRQLVDQEGVRSFLTVPLFAPDGTAVGCIGIYRKEVRAFTEAEIALVETFAAQAVIAIENVRQFREVQARLERERASAEILEVISRSRDDTGPVFEAILKAAAQLCEAPLAFLSMADESRSMVTIPAHLGVRPAFAKVLDAFSEPMDRTELVAVRPIVDGAVIHEEDIAEGEAYRQRDPRRVQMVEVEGARTALSVPLIANGVGIGAIVLYRREVKPFDADQVQLVETFAAQAVIAIENVRQFREVQERLERERATGEVLSVISTSRDDDQPVFDTILQKACALCNAPQAALILGTVDDSAQRLAAQVNAAPAAVELFESGQMPMDGNISYAARSIIEARLVAFDDMRESDLYLAGSPVVRSMVDDAQIRSVLFVPLLKGGVAIGNITLFRYEVRPFTASEILLIETFAAQAVIAIENVRQFREVQERLERERASSEILEVISRSRDDELPVFKAILDSASRLCDADTSGMLLATDHGAEFELVTTSGRDRGSFRPGFRLPMTDDPQAFEALRTARVVHLEDLRDTEAYNSGHPVWVSLADGDGVRTRLVVPLKSGDQAIGAVALSRLERRAFSEDEIALLETFAAQAVIAIENVRQFNALEALNAELGERVEEQVGEIERMGKLKRFLPAAVADTVVAGGNSRLLDSHRALIAVLFCDIRGFTAFCEQAEPEETIELLQTYQAAMGEIIAASGAGVDQRYGDGIMVIFNDPVPCDDPAGAALETALAMQARMADLAAGWKKLGYRLGFGVGISLGYATVGLIGVEGRTDYAAAGTAVNLAARLCDRAEDGDILLSARAATAVEDTHALEPLGDQTFKGFHAPVEVFRLADTPEG